MRTVFNTEILKIALFSFIGLIITIIFNASIAATEIDRLEINVSNKPKKLIDLSLPIVATVGEIEFRDCVVESQGRDRTLQCAWFQVAENPAEKESKKIDLFIARIPAKKPIKALDPMLFLAGGPGQSASRSYLHIDRPFDRLSKDRDFYLVDQRGTGHSNPLVCGKDIAEEQSKLTKYDSDVLKDLTVRCLQQLSGDSRFYTTSVAIKDFELVRKALKIQSWNLFGVSYGTRTAIQYMRKYPDAIRTVLLDSVVPPELPIFADIAINSQKILSTLFLRCEKNIECNKNFPNLFGKVNELFVTLKKAPIDIEVENFSSGQQEKTKFTHYHLMTLIRLYLYDSASIAILPPMLYEASVNNNFAPIARAFNNMSALMNNVFSTGMHNAVVCTEDFPFFQLDKMFLEKNEETYLGTTLLESIQTTCEVWPKGIMDPDFKEKIISEIPTLIFSGEYDPITPPKYGESILAGLKNAKHWIFKGQGHFVSVKGCAPYLVENFVNDASVEWLNDSCLKRLNAAPLFINFNGPKP